MNNYIISTDTCVDFEKSYCDENNLNLVPINVIIDDEFYNSYDLDLDEFYSHLKSGENITTTASNPQTFEDSFENILKQGQDILHIAFSGALSSSFGNANFAINNLKEKYPERKIILIDSKAATNCQSLLVDIAVEMKKEGKNIDEVANKIIELTERFDVDFIIKDLFFLHKGGRVSKSQAVLGTALNINPILTLNREGKIVQTDKVRTRKKAVKKIFDKFVEYYDRDFKSKIFISHGNSKEEAEQLRDKILEYDKDVQVVLLNESITIASHTGPGTLLISYISTNPKIDWLNSRENLSIIA